MERESMGGIQKKEFRKRMLNIRDTLPPEKRRKADELRIARLLSMPEYQRAKLVLSYVSFRSEADTHALIAAALSEKKAVAVPRVLGQQMSFYRISSFLDLEEGYLGILEPKESCPQIELGEYRPDEVFFLVPGAAFDRSGGRIGYGGGFYDRFMESFPWLGKIAPAYTAQLTECVPREKHDFCVDYVVTEDAVISCSLEVCVRKSKRK